MRRAGNPPPKICSTAVPMKSGAMPICSLRCAHSFWRASASPTDGRGCTTAPYRYLSRRSRFAAKRVRWTISNLAAALANLSQALTDAGHLAGAEAYIQQALALSQTGDAPPSTLTADILLQYGYFLLNAKSEPEPARQRFDEALKVYRNSPGDQHLAITSTLGAIAATAIWLGDFVVAEQYQRQVLNLVTTALSRNHPDRSESLTALGYILIQRGKYAEAEQLLNEALQSERSVFGADNQRLASIEAHLGIVYDRQGDLARAISSTEDALRITINRLGSGHYMTGYYLDALANLYLDANDLTAAESSARQALALYDNALPARHLYVSATRQLLGEVLLRRGQFGAAEIELRRALDIDTALAGAANWRTARTRASLGWLLILENHAADGEPMLVTAQSQLLAALGPQHPEVVQATARLARIPSCASGADAARIVAPN